MFTSVKSASIIGVSTLLLTHSCYSAYEHSLISIGASNSLPLDVIIETLASVFLLCVGIVLNNSQELKPISWSVWSGQLERERGSGPYEYLEGRLGFLDIRTKREEFAKWVKEGSKEAGGIRKN